MSSVYRSSDECLAGCHPIQSHRQPKRRVGRKQRARSRIEVGTHRDRCTRVNQLAPGRSRYTKVQRNTWQHGRDGCFTAKQTTLMRRAGLQMIDAQRLEPQGQVDATDGMKLLCVDFDAEAVFKSA